ncbi:MAG: hypothetical protein JKY42_06880 [Flavobacteriales bacterium]|nr:hypothetical protein [Flavobacteriales bacterium]
MRNILIIVALATFPTFGFSQYYAMDYGILAGASQYLGEFGGKEKEAQPWILDLKMGQTRYAFGGFYRYRFMDKIAVNVQYNYIRLQGADNFSTNDARVGRNLSFRNDIHEFSTRFEYYFYHVNDVGHTGRYQLDFRAYVFGGAGVFYNNPKASHESWGGYNQLRPLQTEGVEYSAMQLSIPFGVGAFYTYKKNHRFGWEFGVRKTFTDYIDDASTVYIEHKTGSIAGDYANRYDPASGTTIGAEQYGVGAPRGNPKNKDWYMTTQFSYSYVIRGKRKFTKKQHSYLYSNKKRKRRTRAKF